MIIFPAIDIKGGECVRLKKGVFSTAEKVADNYMDTALKFQDNGAEWLHMVDLDGAKAGKPINNDIFIEVAQKSKLKVQLGGGIRNLDTVEYYLKNGISRVILGSIALKNPELVKIATLEFGDRVAVGIDALDEMVAVEGWLDSSQVNYLDLARSMCDIGVKCIIFTDISRDGTLSGPNLAQLKNLNDTVESDVIASGGISSINDIASCKGLRLYGTICGKSLYSGNICLKDAIKIAEGE